MKIKKSVLEADFLEIHLDNPGRFGLSCGFGRHCMKVEHNAEFRIVADRSRFFAIIFPAADEVDMQKMVRLKKGEQRKANHHCWAFRGRVEKGALHEKSRDDGEVGHPGRVLLELLRHYELEGGLLVSRVFGGVKLGVGGVSRAFREAGAGAIAEYKKNLNSSTKIQIPNFK
jgi:putative IMPACT (imprinted ancient) family translation regulator